MKYYYKRTEFSSYELYTVGYDDSNGDWHPESDHNKVEAAVNRVNFLNGGMHSAAEYLKEIEERLIYRLQKEFPDSLDLVKFIVEEHFLNIYKKSD